MSNLEKLTDEQIAQELQREKTTPENAVAVLLALECHRRLEEKQKKLDWLIVALRDLILKSLARGGVEAIMREHGGIFVNPEIITDQILAEFNKEKGKDNAFFVT